MLKSHAKHLCHSRLCPGAVVRVTELRLRNFRSFGPGPAGKGHPITFRGARSYLVGENNSGKSNIFGALKLAPILATGTSPQREDYHLGNLNVELALGMEFTLERADIDMVLESFQLARDRARERAARAALTRYFGRCSLAVKFRIGRRSVVWKVGQMYAWDRFLLFHPPDLQRGIDGHRPITFETLIERRTPGRQRSSLQSLATEEGIEPDKVAVQFSSDVGGMLSSLLLSRIGVFDEVRFRPQGRGEAVGESYDGSRVADMIFALKNGSDGQRRRWDSIRSKFRDIFPNLDLEVVGSTNAPRIVVLNPRHHGLELPLERIGAGIGQVITLLAHLVGAEGRVFAIEVPESHLHPHALRTLLSFFDDVASSNQVIVATHSPLASDAEDLVDTVIVHYRRNESAVHQIPEGAFSDAELRRLESRLGPEAREFLFAKKLVLVEGETELGALPVLARGVSLDPDKLGVSFVGLGGKHFALLAKAAAALGIAWVAVCDRDALMDVESSFSIGNTKTPASPVLAQLADMGVLSESEVRLLRAVARKVKRNRSGQGSYPARHFSRLAALAEAHDVYVWETDLEGVLRGCVPRALYVQFSQETRSKVIRARMLAREIADRRSVPRWLQTRLRRIVSPPN